jgi:hypothetical protein
MRLSRSGAAVLRLYVVVLGASPDDSTTHAHAPKHPNRQFILAIKIRAPHGNQRAHSSAPLCIAHPHPIHIPITTYHFNPYM